MELGPSEHQAKGRCKGPQPQPEQTTERDEAKCDGCGKSFAGPDGLRKHLRLGRCKGTPALNEDIDQQVTTDGAGGKTCAGCGKSFASVTNVRRHLATGKCKGRPDPQPPAAEPPPPPGTSDDRAIPVAAVIPKSERLVVVLPHHTDGNKCAGCGKVYKNASGAREHVKFGRCPVWGQGISCPLPSDHHNTQRPELPRPLEVYGVVLKVVSSFKYLGRVMTDDDNDDTAVAARLSTARGVFAGLKRQLFKYEMSPNTRVAIFESVVVSSVLYGCETWVLSVTSAQALDTFQQRGLRHCLNMHPTMVDGRPNYPRAVDVLRKANVRLLSERVRERIRSFGSRLADSCPSTYTILQGRVPHARRGHRPLLADAYFARETAETRGEAPSITRSSPVRPAEVRQVASSDTANVPPGTPNRPRPRAR